MAPFTPRERKHRKRARTEDNNNNSSIAPANSNAEILLPRDERREQLKQDLRAPDVKVNAKKRKRLDKYVDSKLRKEENADIISKLAQQRTVDTSLLQSSKRLGRVGESKKERLKRALRERKAGIGDGDGDSVLYQRRNQAEETMQDSSDAESDKTAEVEEVSATSAQEPSRASAGATFGGGLKTPLTVDAAGRPLIRKRKRRRKNSILAPQTAFDGAGSDVNPESDLSDELADSSGHDEGGSESDEWRGFSDVGDNAASVVLQTLTSDEEASEDGQDTDDDNISRISAFKQWADAQRNAASGFTPSTVPTLDANVKANFKPRAPSPDPILIATDAAPSSARRAAAITIDRAESVQAARLELPVVQEEQKIMEAIHNNRIIVLCGATGSGKTTQIPQMLYENGYGSRLGAPATSSNTPEILHSKGMIGITQPRRVAATSVADRVLHELGPMHRKKVAHQVRYDSSVGRDTAIKFMTDGILLREIQQDFALTKYSCVVVDEAHERSVNTDILIGLLSRIVPLRSSMSQEEPNKYAPLKLIIMSATLRVADFLNNEKLFRDGPPPIVEAEGRQFPVTVHFARRTRKEFLDEMVEKVTKGHRRLPPGGMLVFLTGQQEIQTVAARLEEQLAGSHANDHRARDEDQPLRNQRGFVEDEMNPGAEEDDGDVEIETEEDNEFAVPAETAMQATGQHKGPLKPQILPLYAALPAAQQVKVFDAPPEGHRQIVLATNVAETSLTIPGISYVFDCGRSKEKVYSTSNGSGIQSFETRWISKASASQRTGRAGRTAPGHCWRLYSSAVYEEFFPEHADPEILRTPLESVVLQLKGFAVDNVVNFPFPTPPGREALVAAEGLLRNLGAMGEDGVAGLSNIGDELARLPVSPRFGKMLLKGRGSGVLEYIVALVAGLAVGELFVSEPMIAAASTEDEEEASTSPGQEEQRRRHQAYTRAHAQLSKLDGRSDAVKLLTAVVMHAESGSRQHDHGDAFCAQYFLRAKGMQETQQLRSQLWNVLAMASSPGATPGPFQPLLKPPTDPQLGCIRQAVVSGFVDQVAIRADLLPSGGGDIAFGRQPRRAAEVPYRPLVPLLSTAEDTSPASLEPSERELARSLFVHPSSVLSRVSVAQMPAYVVYSHLSQSSGSTSSSAKVRRTRMHALTAVGPKTVARMAEGTPLVVYGKPVTGGGARVGIVEREGGKRRECWVPVSVRSPGAEVVDGGAEWAPLDCWRVLQRRGRRGEWVVERVLEYSGSSIVGGASAGR